MNLSFSIDRKTRRTVRVARNAISSWVGGISGLFAIDPRSLRAFRVALGIVLLVDVIIRASSLEAHYTDVGVMPSALVAAEYEGTWRWSLHLFSGGIIFQCLLFTVSGIAAICLAFGLYAPAATVACWLLWASVQTRTPLLQNGGDDLLRMLLFWAMFLPLPSRSTSANGSLSTRRSPSRIASAAILLQVCFMYFFAGSWKLTGDWINGDELHRILGDGYYARPLAYFLQSYPALTSVSGTAVVFAEHLAPVLLLFPQRFWRLRCLTIAALALMHVGIELTLTVGLFSFVCWTALLLFLPSGFWDHIARTDADPVVAERMAHDTFRSEARAVRASSRSGWMARKLADVIVLVSLVYVIAWNLTDRRGISRDWIPMAASRVGNVLSLQQTWRLFDCASSRDGWFIVLARLPEYQYADMLRGGVTADEKTFSRPVYPYRQLPDHRWRKFYGHLVDETRQSYREALCRYYAMRWERDHEASDEHHGNINAEAIELQYMQELNDPEDPDAYMQRFLCTFELDAQSPP